MTKEIKLVKILFKGIVSSGLIYEFSDDFTMLQKIRLQKIRNASLKAVDTIFWTDYYVKSKNRRIGFHDSTYPFEKSEIAFVHIPKTGGTSLHSVLGTDHLQRFVGLNMHRPISRLHAPEDYKYITVMRNPVDRVYSYYRMVLRSPTGYPYQKSAERGLEFFLTHCWEARNMACRYYAGNVVKEPSEKTLKSALKNLMQFECVISFDDFETEATQYLLKMGISLVTLPHSRKSKYRPPNQHDCDLIGEYNALDIELFKRYTEHRIFLSKDNKG